MEVTPQGFGNLRCKHFRAVWSKLLLSAEALRALIAVNQVLPGQTLLLSETLLWASPCAGRLEQPRVVRAKRRVNRQGFASGDKGTGCNGCLLQFSGPCGGPNFGTENDRAWGLRCGTVSAKLRRREKANARHAAPSRPHSHLISDSSRLVPWPARLPLPDHNRTLKQNPNSTDESA